MVREFDIKGTKWSVTKSPRKNKEYLATNLSTGKKVHFADPSMPEYPGTKRGNSYCARSSGIPGKNDPSSANFWSRKLWSCKGKKSVSKRRFST